MASSGSPSFYSSSNLRPNSASSSSKDSTLRESNDLIHQFAKAISILMERSVKIKDPTQNRREKLSAVDDSIQALDPDSFLSPLVKKVVLLFQTHYLQKNADPDYLQRAQLGYPLQVNQEIENELGYHREQASVFWFEVIDALFPNAEMNFRDSSKTLVNFPLLAADLGLQHAVLQITQPEEFLDHLYDIELASGPTEKSSSGKLYLILSLSEAEKQVPKVHHGAILNGKEQALREYIEREEMNDTIAKLFPEGVTVIGRLEVTETLSFIIYQNDSLMRLIGPGAYAPTMLQLHEINPSKLPLSGTLMTPDSIPPSPSFGEMVRTFTESENYKSYLALAKTYEGHSAERQENPVILASANANLIDKLLDEMKNNSTLNSSNELRNMIHLSLQRLEILLQKSVEQKDHSVKYNMLHELIAEELLLQLNLIHPYKPDDFNQTLTNIRKDEQYQILPYSISSSSGMAAFNDSIRAVAMTFPGRLQIYFLESSYYEIQKLHAFSSYRGDNSSRFKILKISNRKFLKEIRKRSHSDSLFPDIFALTIRSTPSHKGADYTPFAEVKEGLDMLLQRQPEGKHLSVLLDVTNDSFSSDEIRSLINGYAESIENRSVSFILFRSGHKFLQLGVDKFNAGSAELYSNHQELKDNFRQTEGALTGLDYQSLTHFTSCAHTEIDSYTKLHQQNTKILYDYLRPRLSEKEENGLTLYLNEDEKAYFIQITPQTTIQPSHEEWQEPHATQEGLNNVVVEALCRMANRNGIAVTPRDSFGYNETVTCQIGETIRISVGTHSPDQMEKLCKIIEELHETIRDFTPRGINAKRIERERDDVDAPPAKRHTSDPHLSAPASSSIEEENKEGNTPHVGDDEYATIWQNSPLIFYRKPLTQLVEKLDLL